MRIKKTIKGMGKYFVPLKRENEGFFRQSVLVVDNGYSWIGHLDSGIERIRNCFPKAEISVLTFEHRKVDLQREFADLDYILPSRSLRPKKYRIALQMLKTRKQRHNLIVLFSLDITPLIVALVFLKSRVVLYNQWGQLWSLRLRNVNEIFKITYVKKRARSNLKNLLKRIGLFFVLLQRRDYEALTHSILVIDNGYALFEQIGCAIRKIKESLPYAKVSVLTLREGGEFKGNFPDLEIIQPGECIVRKYRIARHMVRLRKNRYDDIILLSLDITPIITSILFKKSKVILYNQWHQWWSFKPKSLKGYLMTIPQFIYSAIIFVYLLISVSLIFLKRSLNVFRFSFLRKRI